MIDLKGIHLPFDVSELVSSGMALLGFVAPFVLLGLAFIFVVRIISTIFSSFKDNAERDEYGISNNSKKKKDGDNTSNNYHKRSFMIIIAIKKKQGENPCFLFIKNIIKIKLSSLTQKTLFDKLKIES